MNDLHLTDRIPDVMGGRGSWSAAESSHLDNCPDCQAEWDVVASYLGMVGSVDVDRVVGNVNDALGMQGTEASSSIGGHRRRWLPIGLAAAASIALAVTTWQLGEGTKLAVVTSAAPALLPELDELVESELELLLASIEVPTDDYGAGSITRLGDLTDSELMTLLADMEDF